MRVYTLSGKSGTGKSYQALDLCEKYGIEAIIDDGLLINGGRIIAGKSAKRQATTIRAIKTALFKEDNHKNEVVRALKTNNIESVLVLGTSEKMVDLIMGRLELPEPEKRIQIESITTPEERVIAEVHRHDLGEHIIPAPTMEIKKDFSGYFLHPLKRFKDLYPDGRWGSRKKPAERSVVRPSYSYLGRYILSDKTIRDIIYIAAGSIEALDSVSDAYVQIKSQGVIIEAGIIVKYGFSILKAAEELQKKVAEEVDLMTSLNILSVDIEVEGLMWNNNVRNNQNRDENHNQ